MQFKTITYRALLLTIISTVQPCWAQLIDPATQVKTSASSSGRRVFDMRSTDLHNTGMSPEIIRPSAIDVQRSEIRHVSPAVIEQIGRVKQSVPNHFGVP